VPSALTTFRSSQAPLAAPAPTHLDIPAIGVRSRLERLGQNSDHTVEVPKNWLRAGWYEDGPAPGEPGAAVILGHVDSPTGPAVFAGLSRLRRGDRVLVRRADETTVQFIVEHIELYSRSDFPATEVYWPTLRPELRLITCGGRYIRSRGGYQSNVVVFALATHTG
jgi:sortase (surface protein transpeptidase)